VLMSCSGKLSKSSSSHVVADTARCASQSSPDRSAAETYILLLHFQPVSRAQHRCRLLLLISWCSVVCLSVCVCVGHVGELCRNGWSDCEPVWDVDLCESKEPRISWGSSSLCGKGHFWGGFQPVEKHCTAQDLGMG